MIIPENYGEAVAVYEFIDTGERMTTSFGYHNIGTDDATSNSIQLSTSWRSIFTAATTLDSYRMLGMYVIQMLGGVLQSAQTADNMDGTVNADPVSPAVAVGVKKQTSYAGKKYRGRMYLPPAFLGEANVNGAGVIDGATVTAIQGRADDLIAELNSVDLPMYLLHSDATSPTHVDDLIVRSNVRTQRRRQKLR